MSISGDLNAKALGAQKASDNFATDDESANSNRNWFDETHGIDSVPVTDERDETTEKQNKKQPPRIEDTISDKRSILVGNPNWKKRSKPTKC